MNNVMRLAHRARAGQGANPGQAGASPPPGQQQLNAFWQPAASPPAPPPPRAHTREAPDGSELPPTFPELSPAAPGAASAHTSKASSLQSRSPSTVDDLEIGTPYWERWEREHTAAVAAERANLGTNLHRLLDRELNGEKSPNGSHGTALSRSRPPMAPSTTLTVSTALTASSSSPHSCASPTSEQYAHPFPQFLGHQMMIFGVFQHRTQNAKSFGY